MSRPRKNNADYFSHDSDMRNDPAMLAIRRTFGPTGYAIYNMLLEVLTDSDNFITTYDELNRKLLAADFQIDRDLFESIVSELRDMKLIQLEGNIIRCYTLEKRFEGLLSRRFRERRELSATETPPENNNREDNGQSKVKESIVEESKSNESVNYHELYVLNDDKKLEEILSEPGLLFDTLCMRHGIDRKDALDLIHVFVMDQRIKHTSGRTLKEYRSNLTNWIGTELIKRRNNHPKSESGLTYHELCDLCAKNQAVFSDYKKVGSKYIKK